MRLFVSAWFAVMGASFAPACSKETPPAPPAAPVPAPEAPKAPPTVVEPKPAEPAAVEPKPAEPAAVEPKPAEPAPAEPAPAEPAPAEPAPAEPAPAEPAPAEPAPAEPEPAAGDDGAPEKMHEITLNAVELTKEVVDRLPGEVRSNWVIGQDPEFLIWMEFNNPGGEIELETVWKKGGTEKWRFPFNVGKAKNWRTYVTKRIGKRDAGDWTVEIVDAGGYVYKSVPFTISEN